MKPTRYPYDTMTGAQIRKLIAELRHRCDKARCAINTDEYRRRILFSELTRRAKGGKRHK